MRPTRRFDFRRWLRSDWVILPLFVLTLLAARSSLADHYHVPSGSMENSIMTGDRVLIDKTAYGIEIPFTGIEAIAIGTPQRGDVVVFDSPADGTRLIKRIAAVGGDVVTVRNGRLVVNGQRLAASDGGSAPEIEELFGEHRARINLDTGGGPDIAAMTIPAGKLLALGDHRGDSFDSRYFGLVDAQSVYGRALGVYYRRGEGITWHAL